MDRVEAFARDHRITDPIVLDFYEANPEVDFQEVNVRAAQMMQGVRRGADTDVARELREFRAQVAGNLTTTMAEHQRTWLETMRMMVAGASADTSARLATVLDQQVEVVVHRLQATEALARMKEDQWVARSTTERLSAAIDDFLQKQGISQHKGAASEAVLEETLTALFPSATVTNLTGHTGCGDFRLERPGACTVMFENKDYKDNVKHTEVQKFQRDATAGQCSAVLLSQHSGIVGKRDFEIEVNDGRVLVYVHHAAPEKITAAVCIVDALESRLAAVDTDGTFLAREVVQAVNAEVEAFMQKKAAIIAVLKETCKRTVAQVEDLHLPELTRILRGQYVSADAKAYPCEVCGRTFPSPRALGAHRRSHG